MQYIIDRIFCQLSGSRRDKAECHSGSILEKNKIS